VFTVILTLIAALKKTCLHIAKKLDLRVWKLDYVFHFRVNPTNDSINRVIPTDNSVYLYKYAFSCVQQYGDYRAYRTSGFDVMLSACVRKY